MKHTNTLLLFFWIIAQALNTSAQAPGDPDVTFGAGGFNITNVGASNTFGRSVAVQADGKIVVACIVSNGLDNDFGLVRYHPNGAIDTSFGNAGLVTYDFAMSTEITEAVAIDHANRIIVAGSVDTGDGFAFAAVRFTPEGEVDPTFGVLGFVLVKAWTTGFCQSMVIQDDHKILLAGYAFNPVSGANEYAIVRFLESGMKDATFGQQGIVLTNLGIGAGVANAITLQQDGKILLAGQALNNSTFLWEISLARYETNGLLDSSWGTEGIAFMAFPDKNFTINTVDIDHDKNIVVAGYLGTAPSNNLYAVARFDKEGMPDPSFGTDGLVMNSFGAQNNQVNDLEIQPDGFMLISGTSLSGNSDRLAIARLDKTGHPDPSFGQEGNVITPLGQNDGIKATALQSDGKLLVAGESFNGNQFQLVVGRYITGITTGIRETTDSFSQISVYPNPATEQITVSMPGTEHGKLQVVIYNAAGMEVMRLSGQETIQVGALTFTINLPDALQPGIYYLSVINETKVYSTCISILK